MAIALQSRVRIRETNVNAGPPVSSFAAGGFNRVSPQPPIDGVVVSGQDPWSVLFRDGTLLALVPGAVLSEITAPSQPNIDAWLNKIVLPPGFSQEYTAQVVSVFGVIENADVAASTNLLCKMLSNGEYYEIRLGALVPDILGDR